MVPPDGHGSDHVMLVLLALMNPLIDSMRVLQQVASLPEVQKRLGIKPFSLGSFSESCRIFDPAMLQEVVVNERGRSMIMCIPNPRSSPTR